EYKVFKILSSLWAGIKIKKIKIKKCRMSNKNHKTVADQSSYDTSRDVVMTDGISGDVGKMQDRGERQPMMPSTSTMSSMTGPTKGGDNDSAMQTKTSTTTTVTTTGRGKDSTDKSNRHSTYTIPDKYTTMTNNNHNNNGQTNNDSDSENKVETIAETNTPNNDESEKKERDNDLNTDETMTDKDKYRNAYLSNFKPSREDEVSFNFLFFLFF
ncbi:leucine-rich repeat-containing protein, partial [Reticulomyxa filosa]